MLSHADYSVETSILLIFHKTINAEDVMFAVIQIMRGTIIAVMVNLTSH